MQKADADNQTINLQNQMVSQAIKFLETAGDESLKADVLKALLGRNQNTNNTINNG